MSKENDIKDYIAGQYDKFDTLGVYYDAGNYDDAYLMGKQHGQTELLYFIGTKLLGMDLEEPEYSWDNELAGVV